MFRANLIRRLLPPVQYYARNYAKEVPKVKTVVHPNVAKLKQVQKKFGIDDGLPVWLKSGISDKLLYQASWALILISLGLVVDMFVQIIRINLGYTKSK